MPVRSQSIAHYLLVLYELTAFLRVVVVAIKSHYTVSVHDTRYYRDHSAWSAKQNSTSNSIIIFTKQLVERKNYWWRYFVIKVWIYMVSLLDFINSISYTDNIQDVNARTVGGSVDLLALGGRLTPPLGGRLTPLACTHTYNCKHFTTFINV